jgi:hypothetical protein
MIDAPELGQAVAQIGYGKLPGTSNGIEYFTEWYQGPGYHDHLNYFGNPTFGDVHAFKVVWNNPSDCTSSTSYCLEMLLDGNEKDVTNFDPYVKWPWDEADFYAEVNYPGNDIPGTPDNPAVFNNVQERNLSSNWVSMQWGVSQDCPSNYQEQTLSSYTSFENFSVIAHDNTC